MEKMNAKTTAPSRATKKKVCKTPGAWWHCHVEKANAVGQTAINMGVTLPMLVNEKQARRIEKQFHDKMEELLAFLWETPVLPQPPGKQLQPKRGDHV